MNIEEINKLSDNELRVKVAELCGWKEVTPQEANGTTHFAGYYQNPKADWHRVQPWALPNYPTDLNAMHEAEKVLSIMGQRLSYRYKLRVIVDDGLSDEWNYIHATARQRAEAFVLTLYAK